MHNRKRSGLVMRRRPRRRSGTSFARGSRSWRHTDQTDQCSMYLRLTWKCEVGAQLGLKRLIWG